MDLRLFKYGQRVTWRNPDANVWYIQQGHLGPFRIVAVKLIPPDLCQCGRKTSDSGHMSQERPEGRGHRPLHKLVGHPQWVHIVNGKGEAVGDRWSGAHFVHVT